MSEIEESAKAIAETVKLCTTSVEAITKIGGFLSKVFDMPIESAIGIIGDKIEYARWERQNRFIDKVNEEQQKRGLTQFRAVPPKFAIPIIVNASIEEDNDLQDLWCKLITNYSDPNFDMEIRYAFIDMIKSLTTLDAKILKYVYDITMAINKKSNLNKPDTKTTIFGSIATYNLGNPMQDINVSRHLPKSNIIPVPVTLNQIQENIKSSASETEISLNNLKRVQCLWDNAILQSRIDLENSFYEKINKGLTSIRIPRLTDSYVITPLGEAFILACIK